MKLVSSFSTVCWPIHALTKILIKYTDQIYWSNILINILIKYTAQIYWPIYWSIYWSNILIKYTAQIYWSIYWPIYWPVYWAVDAYWHRRYTFNFARTCMIRKWGLLTFSWTDRKRSCTREGVALLPLIRYLFRPPITTYKYTCSTKAYIQMLSGPLRGTSFHGLYIPATIQVAQGWMNTQSTPSQLQ